MRLGQMRLAVAGASRDTDLRLWSQLGNSLRGPSRRRARFSSGVPAWAYLAWNQQIKKDLDWLKVWLYTYKKTNVIRHSHFRDRIFFSLLIRFFRNMSRFLHPWSRMPLLVRDYSLSKSLALSPNSDLHIPFICAPFHHYIKTEHRTAYTFLVRYNFCIHSRAAKFMSIIHHSSFHVISPPILPHIYTFS